MSNVSFTAVTAGADWDLAKLQKNSKVFNNYLRSNIAKVAGTTRFYNRNLVKPITVADGVKFMITVKAAKKTNTDLTITYKVTLSDGTEVIAIDGAAYKTKEAVIADLDEVDADIAKIA